MMDAEAKAELHELVSEAAGAAVEAKLKKLEVPAEQHLLDHRFVNGVRSGIAVCRKSALTVLGGSTVLGVGWAIKAWIAEIFSKGTP